MIRRGLPALLAIVIAAAGCNGSSSSGGTSTHGATVPTSKTLPASGTARLPDHRIYTVAAPGQTLTLDDIALKIVGVGWAHHVRFRAGAGGSASSPGTSIYAVVAVSVTNRSAKTQTVSPTQIWLLDQTNQPFLASPTVLTPRPVIGHPVPAGGTYTGHLVYGLPARIPFNLLVYRFADSTDIAHAKRVGVARYSPAT